MSEKKHIDRLFQEKFKEFEEAPKEHVWKNIQKELQAKQQKKVRVVPLWYKMAGVAVAITLLLLVGNEIFSPFSPVKIVHEETPAETQQNQWRSRSVNRALNPNGELDKTENKTKENLHQQKLSSEKNGITDYATTSKTISKEEKEQQEQNNHFLKNQKEERQEIKLAKVGQETATKEPKEKQNKPGDGIETRGFNVQGNKNLKTQVANLQTDTEKEIEGAGRKDISGKNKKENAAPQSKKRSLLAVAEQQKKEKLSKEQLEQKQKSSNSKWQISPFAAPVFYSSFGGSNAVDPSLAENESSGGTSMTYGISVAYQISDKVRIRSGISQVSMDYHVKDIAFAPRTASANFSNLNYNPIASHLQIWSQGQQMTVSPEQSMAARPSVLEGTLKQNYGFIEIPLEIEYTLINQKLDLSLIGGVSTLFLDKNQIAIKSAKGMTQIGEANNLNQISFSTNIGLGMDYGLSDEFEISLEPVFKYQWNTFSENINGFKPYYFGVYTGVTFKF